MSLAKTYAWIGGLSCAFGYVAGSIVGSWNTSQNDGNLSKDIAKSGKVVEIVVTDWDGTQRLDTVVCIPLNVSKDFQGAVRPLIEEGKVKVIKADATPKL